MKALKFVTRFNAVPDKPIDFSSVQSATDQQFKKDCDINEMLRVYRITGNLPTRQPPRFGDFSEVSDYMSNLQRMDEVRDMFSSLPASERAKFDGDVGKFLAFCQDPANAVRLVELGIVEGQVHKAEKPSVTAPSAKPSTGVEVVPPTT